MRRGVWGVGLLVLALGCGAQPPICPGPVEGVVAHVIDGDTVVMESGEHVRYRGIDTPELGREGAPDECYAREARRANESLVGGRRVRLEYEDRCRDGYGRLLAHVWRDEVLVAERLLQEGDGRLDLFDDRLHTERLAAAEREARIGGRGLWSACASP